MLLKLKRSFWEKETSALTYKWMDRLEPRCHGTVIGSWKLRESVAYGDGMGVSTDAARDASGARGHLSSGE